MLWQSATHLIGKTKVSKCLRARRPPQPSAQSRRPWRRRPTRPSMASSALPPGRPYPQTTSPGASQQPRVSKESSDLRGSSIGLVCSGGTAHPPPHSLVCSKHPLKPSGRSNICNNILAAFEEPHPPKPNDFRGRLVVSFAAVGQAYPSSAATHPQPSLRVATAGPRSPPYCGRGLVHRRDTPCGSPVTSGSVPPSHIPHSRPHRFLCRSDDHRGRPVAASEAVARAPSFRRGLVRDSTLIHRGDVQHPPRHSMRTCPWRLPTQTSRGLVGASCHTLPPRPSSVATSPAAQTCPWRR